MNTTAIVAGCAVPLTAQSTDARDIKIAVAAYVKSSSLALSLYAGRRVVLDTTRLAKLYDADIHADTRPRTVTEGRNVAELVHQLNAKVGTEADLPKCDEKADRPPANCGPLDVVSVQFGEPTLKGDDAFVVFQLSSIEGKTRIFPFRNLLVAVLMRESGIWHVTSVKGNLYPR